MKLRQHVNSALKKGTEKRSRTKYVIQETEKSNCDFCGNTYKDNDEFLEHIVSIHAEEIKKHDTNTSQDDEVEIIEPKSETKCKACEVSFSSEEGILKHMKHIHPDIEPRKAKKSIKMNEAKKKFPCKVCPKGFDMLSEKNKHMFDVHNGKESKCEMCQLSVWTDKQLKKHWKLNPNCKPTKISKEINAGEHDIEKIDLTEETEPKSEFQCPKCSKVLKAKRYFKQHMDEVHGRIKNFKCDKCEQNFTRLLTLKRHVEVVHSKVHEPITVSKDVKIDEKDYETIDFLNAM